jgi:hypothetical protein
MRGEEAEDAVYHVQEDRKKAETTRLANIEPEIPLKHMMVSI